MSKARRSTLAVLCALGLFVATSAESCSTTSKKLNQSVAAMDATCNDIAQGNVSRDDFAAAEADEANLSSQTLDQTKAAALSSLDKHCGSNQNLDYKPYTDVQMDITGLGSGS